MGILPARKIPLASTPRVGHGVRVTLKMLLRLSWSSLLAGIVAGVLLLSFGGAGALAWAVLSVVVGLAVALVALVTCGVAKLLQALTSLYVLIDDTWTARMRDADKRSRVFDVLAEDPS